MPEEFRAYGESWLKHHPGWTMQLWGDDNLPPMRNRDLFDTAPTYASKSDILRFEVVWQFGGVYLDTDIECVQSIEGLLVGVENFVAHEFSMGPLLCNAVLGSVARSPLFAVLIEGLPASIAEHGHAMPPTSTGPGYLTRTVDAFHAGGGTAPTVFPASYFFPYSWLEPHRRFEKFPNAYGIHHWAHSWGTPSGSRLERLLRRGLMRTSLTRRVLYLEAWLRRHRHLLRR